MDSEYTSATSLNMVEVYRLMYRQKHPFTKGP